MGPIGNHGHGGCLDLKVIDVIQRLKVPAPAAAMGFPPNAQCFIVGISLPHRNAVSHDNQVAGSPLLMFTCVVKTVDGAIAFEVQLVLFLSVPE